MGKVIGESSTMILILVIANFVGQYCNGYREYVYSAVVYQKYLTRLRELIIFEPWRENYHFSQPS